ncbi:Lrp/AsnC family transcriptional regulator [Actinosynnema sp. NPDC004786]
MLSCDDRARWTSRTLSGPARFARDLDDEPSGEFRTGGRAAPHGVTPLVAAVRNRDGLPDVMTIGHLTGAYNLYALTIAASMQALTNFHMRVLTSIQATALRTHLYHHAYGGSRWRVRTLRESQVAQFATKHVTRSGSWTPIPMRERRLFLALAADARRPLTELADELGGTPQSVGRQLRLAQNRGIIDFRTDVARRFAGWHLAAFFWLHAKSGIRTEACQKLGGMLETRFCVSTSGTERNIQLIVNLRTPEDADSLMDRIEQENPGVHVVDCEFVLRLDKIHGRLLDASGRAVGLVPVDPWASEPP